MKQVFISIWLLVCSLPVATAQTAAFPTSLATDATLKVAGNFIETKLRTRASASDTTLYLLNTTGITANMLLTCEREVMSVSAVNHSNTSVTVSRGFDNTTAVEHSATRTVASYPVAHNFNALSAEIKAMQAALGVGLSNVPNLNETSVGAQTYDFTPQSLTEALTGGIQNVVTLTPCPQGVAGTNTRHYLYVYGGTGTAEAVLITGGTCTSGAATGTLIFTPANSHTGSSIKSATVGIQEALYAHLWSPREIRLPASPRTDDPENDGGLILRGPVYVPPMVGAPTHYRGGWKIQGAGRRMTQLIVMPDFPLTVDGVFKAADHSSGTYGPIFEDFQIGFSHTNCLTRDTCTQFPPAFDISGTYGTEIRNVGIYQAWNGIKAAGTWNGSAWVPSVGGRYTFDHLEMSAAGDYYISLDGILDKVDIIEPYFWPQGITGASFYNDTTVGIKVGRLDALHVIGGMLINKNAMLFHANLQGQGCAFSRVTGTGFDTYGNLTMDCGRLFLANTYHTMAADGAKPLILVNNGGLSISNSWFLNNTNSQPSISVKSTTNSYTGEGLQVTGSRFDRNTNNAATQSPDVLVDLNGGSGYRATLTGNTFYREASQTFGNPVVHCKTGIRCIVQGNHINDKGAGSGTFVATDADDFHVIGPNVTPGWGMSFAGTTNLGGHYIDNRFLQASPTFGNLATSCTGAQPGKVWNDGGTLKVCP
jgi:hypothetical protein